MRYHALACDYDGTLATDGFLPREVRESLAMVRASGRRVILVTGRQIADLQSACGDLGGFDVVVAENGGVLWWPETREERILGAVPSPAFVAALEERGVPIARGRVVLATWQPNESVVLDVIQKLGLELQVVFNKGAVMVLPTGINKGTGLKAALDAMHLSPHNTVGIGDAENDHALLGICECGAAVSNSVPMLKERADLVTRADHGQGVQELIGRLMDNDLADLSTSLSRHDIPIGTAGERVIALPAHGANILLAGTSGGGKSTLATAFLERLDERGYQYCLFDPEGDHGPGRSAVILGTSAAPPVGEEVERLLARPGENAVANLLGVPLEERPVFFEALLRRLEALRSASGHPHWIVVDEAHHMIPHQRASPVVGASPPTNLLLITVNPAHVSHDLLRNIDAIVVIGNSPQQTLREFATSIGAQPPVVAAGPLATGQGLIWWPRRTAAPQLFDITPPKAERHRHIRKYAEGSLSPEQSFYFRGAEGKLNLRAQNLMSFLELGDGVDDETWTYHLQGGHYSNWMRRVVKDDALADEVGAAESTNLPVADSRRAVRAAVEKRYTRSP